MAGIRITKLPSNGVLTTASILPIVADVNAVPPTAFRFTVAQLLNLITITAAGRVYQDTFDPPTAPPPSPGSPAIYYPNGGGVIYQWDVPSQTWK